ncbi:MAG: hypothetical protein KF810_10675 [Rhizobiaceae bacterium]|nr:hypothetical protein [Rhizobiaceae bacterium]
MPSLLVHLLAATGCCFTLAASASADGFRTPSDNIHCMADVWEGTAELRCDIRTNAAAVPAPPSDCDLDWGNAFALSGERKSAYRVCAGDTVMNPDYPVLGYGSTWQKHGFSCSVATDGVTCKNRFGNGFFLSKKMQTLR